MALLPLGQAQQRLLDLAHPLPVQCLALAHARGRFLAQGLFARRTQPPRDLSAMDGFAMRMGDMPGPWRIVGESACGHPFAGTCGPGQSIRIATGALMPAGTDMVLMQEDSHRECEALTLTGTPPDPLDRHIRRQGNDFSQGDLLLARGTCMGPAQLALAASGGHDEVEVRRLPRIAIIDSGDELSSKAAACALHQIPASNGLMLEALVKGSLPCETLRIGPVADRLESLIEALDQSSDCDVIVTSGGASVGDHDLIRPALARWGAEIDFWKVAIKPGKPIMIARRGTQLVVGLPGNPVSSRVTAFLLLLPLLRAMSGSSNPLPTQVWLPVAHELCATGPRREFLRGFWDGRRVGAAFNQDSGALGALARANVLIERPEHSPAAEVETLVPVYLLGDGGSA